MSAPPSERLFITGLPADFDEARTTGVFGAYGTLKGVKFLPGQGKHSAICTFATADEAGWLVDNLNGNIPQDMDQPVTIRYANAPGGAAAGGGWGKDAGCKAGGKDAGKDAGKGGWGGPYGGKGGKDSGVTLAGFGINDLVKGLSQAGALPGGRWSNDENALFVKGLPPDTTDVDLYNIFSPFGAIPCKGIKAMQQEDGTCKGFGFVNFVEAGPCQTAQQTLNGTGMPGGRFLSVTNAKQGPKEGGKGKGKGKGKDE